MDSREDLFRRLYTSVKVKDRRYGLRIYKRCFVGSEAIDFMVTSGWAKSRIQAVQIGLRMQEKHNLFQHVVDPETHVFKDDYLFYEFVIDPDDEVSNQITMNESFKTDEGPLEQDGHVKRQASLVNCPSSVKLGLTTLGEIVRANLKIHYNHSLDKTYFIANEAVDYMVSTGLASTREGGVYLGLALARGGFIRNVKQEDQEFADARLFFYFEGEKSEKWREDLAHARDLFRRGVQMNDLIYRLKKYQHCFTGTQAVDFLISGTTTSRQDAVLIGRAFVHEYNLFQHVTNEHEFEDTDLFYRFSAITRESSRTSWNGSGKYQTG